MAIKASGSSLAFSEIRAELGPPPSSNIGFYRQSFSNSSRYGNLTLEIADGLPTSGEIKFSDFYSKRLNIVVDHFSSNQTRANSRNQYVNNSGVYVVGGDSTGLTKTDIGNDTSGKKIYAHATKIFQSEAAAATRCALRTGSGWTAGTQLQVDIASTARIYGAGGEGGAGANGPNQGGNGQAGSSALGIQFGTSSNRTIVNIANGAIIYGGGGGGGGGAGGFDYDKNSSRYASGGGGGGGAGRPAGEGAAGGTQGTNGGNGGDSGTSGNQPAGAGEGGSGSQNDGQAYGGIGGDGGWHGGNLGFDGNAGQGGSGGENSSNQGGSGGEGGTGLRVTGASNTITLTNNGDIKGGNASFDHSIRYNVTVT